MNHTIGLSEMHVSNNPDDTLITYSLGSCVGLALYDPNIKVGGLVHCVLPLAKQHKEKAALKPLMFTDTGVMALIQALYEHGSTQSSIVAKVAGAASPVDAQRTFKIGERNYAILRKVLWKNSILIAAEDVGGTKPRTMTLDIATGNTTIKSRGEEVML